MLVRVRSIAPSPKAAQHLFGTRGPLRRFLGLPQFASGTSGLQTVHTLISNRGPNLRVTQEAQHVLIFPTRRSNWMSVKKMSSISELKIVQRDHEMQVLPRLLEDALNFGRIHLGEVEVLESAERRARRTSDYP